MGFIYYFFFIVIMGGGIVGFFFVVVFVKKFYFDIYVYEVVFVYFDVGVGLVFYCNVFVVMVFFGLEVY